MNALRVKLLAYRGASRQEYERGKEKFMRLLDQQYVEFVEDAPDILFFLSGGSERAATLATQPGRFYGLIAFSEGNSYAAATEVKAYLNQRGIASVLYDYDDDTTRTFLKMFHEVKQGLQRLNGQRIGLIGEVSDWLIASDIAPQILHDRLGIELRTIPWNTLPDFRTMPLSDTFFKTFPAARTPQLDAANQIYSLLVNCLRDHNLQAITVECFSVVVEHAVTACLSLAKLNADGIPAGCEGDIVSITGMAALKEVTGIVPWIANTVKIGDEKSLFAHCTIAPTLISDYEINTHFETDKGAAIRGKFTADDITLFRFDNTLTQAFITEGSVINRPQYPTACRTQIEVRLPQNAVKLLRERPLGNHQLILPGNHVEKLRLMCQILGIAVQQ